MLAKYSSEGLSMAMEWEVSKENVQPSKGGRNIGILNQVLKAKVEKGEGGSSLTEQRRYSTNMHLCVFQSLAFSFRRL